VSPLTVFCVDATAAAGRQSDSRGRGRVRGRGRGRGQASDRQHDQNASSGSDSMAPPGNLPSPGGQPPAMPSRTIMIKKRPQPASSAPE